MPDLMFGGNVSMAYTKLAARSMSAIGVCSRLTGLQASTPGFLEMIWVGEGNRELEGEGERGVEVWVRAGARRTSFAPPRSGGVGEGSGKAYIVCPR